MLKAGVIGMLLVVAGLLAVAAMRPHSFRVERSATIKARPDRIFPLINDLRSFNRWNPFEKKDPGLKGSYSGPARGKGAAYAFEGNRDVGKGSIEIIESAASSKVSMALRMREPFEADNRVEFTLTPNGETTNVTWSLQGPVPYLARLVHLFFDMDRMIGRDFEAGLASLKSIAEQS